MIVRRKPHFGVITCEGQMKRVIIHKRRQKTRALCGRHQFIEYQAGQHGRMRKHDGDIRIALRQLFHQQTGGQMVGARSPRFLRQRQRAQTHVRCAGKQIRQQRFFKRFQPARMQRDRLDFVVHKGAHGVADFELLRGEIKIVNNAPLCSRV